MLNAAWRPFNQETYHSLCASLKTTSAAINEHHRELDKPVFLEHNWTDTVGLLLKKMGKADKDVIKNCLTQSIVDMQDGGKQMAAIAEMLKTARMFFEETQPIDHPLSLLHKDILLQKDMLQKQALIEKNIHAFQSNYPRI